MKKRYVVLAASCIVNMFIGITYCWAVFSAGFMNEEIFGATVAASTLAWAFSLNTGVGPITMITGGAIRKKLGGVGNVVKLSAVLNLIGLLLVALVPKLPVLYIGFGILAGFGVGMTNGITTTNTGLWFPEKRGTIAGTTTAFFGLGSIIWPFVLRPMVGSIGIQKTILIFAIIIGVVQFICGFFISTPPEGWVPDGFKAPAPGAKAPTTKNYTWREMIADPRYYLAVIAFLFFSAAGLFVIQSGKTMATDIGGIAADAALATYTVSFIGIGNSGGRLLWGAISDKIGRYPSLMIMGALVCLAGFGLTLVNGSYVLFLILVLIIAACYGGSMGIYPALTADNFGPKNNGINYGVMFIGFALGGFVGPIFFSKLRELTSGFGLPLTIVAVMGALALVLIAILTKLRASKNKA
ncbi:MAG: OFA family MFS transporter [Lachnospiraceae bacterium]